MYKGSILGTLFLLSTQTICNGAHTKKIQYFRPRILRGIDAIPGEFPWLVRLKIYLTKNTYAGCGGAIISQWHVITAAHCCANMDLHHGLRKTVLAGEFNLKTDPDCDYSIYPENCLPRVQKFKIDDYLMHRKFKIKYDRALNDICVVRLNAPIQYNDYVYSIDLPYDWKGRNWIGTRATVAGWGLLQRYPEEVHTEILQKANIYVRPCQFKNPNSRFYETQENVICAGDASRNDVCSGDSGGPLMYKDERSKKTILIGIVAKGEVCTFNDSINDPGIYTRVDKFLHWIKKAIRNLKPPTDF